MIPLALLAAATTLSLAQLPGGDLARFQACVALAKKDPAAAVEQADEWAKRSNNVPSRHCLGLAFAAAERWGPAVLTFEQAAQEAELQGDGRAAALWSQAANAALAADDGAKARTLIDHALVLPTLSVPMKGEAWLDRARADVALNDLPQARIDLDKGLALVPQDPFAWLLSATLARRQNDLPRASKDIARAATIAADDPSVALEEGNIAAVSDQMEVAKRAWTRAAQLAPGTPEGKAASAALAQLQDPAPTPAAPAAPPAPPAK
jgi:tetratricopeptide (TPR) repeat protein